MAPSKAAKGANSTSSAAAGSKASSTKAAAQTKAPAAAKQPVTTKGANTEKKTELKDKTQLSQLLREQIASQTKLNLASRKKFRLYGIFSVILTIILAIQLVHSDRFLRKEITIEKATVIGSQTI